MPQYPTALLEQIKQLVPISRLVGEYVQADKAKSQPGDLWACCPFHNERTPSFHAEDAKGIYHCFGCGATGDHFQWMQEHQGMTFTQAVEAVADMAGVSLPGTRSEPSAVKPRARYEAPVMADPYEGYEFIPVPAETAPIVPGQKTPPLRNPKRLGTDKFTTHYKPSAVYPYHNAAGELLGYVLLVPFKDGKSTPGIWWARGPDGFEGWCHGSLENAPLYGLPELQANPGKQVLVVEGEKCRDAAQEALQGRVVVVSWCGGTNRVDRTDWTPLAGRSVIWWADNDDEGRKAMEAAYIFAKSAKNKRVTEYRTQQAGEYKKGGDVADLVEAGGSVSDYIKANISEWKEIEDAKHDNAEAEHSSGRSGTDSAATTRGSAKSHDRLDQDAVGPKDAKPTRQFAIHESDSKAQRGALNDANPEPAASPEPSAQPSPAPENNSTGTQSLGGVSREAVAQDPDPIAANWEEHLKFTKDGSGLVKNSIHNVSLILQYHDLFKGIFAFNSFSKEIYLMRKPAWERSWKGKRTIDDTDVTACAGFMETIEHGGVSPKRSDMEAVIARVATFNRFNPVLDAVEALQWDGRPRLQGGKFGNQTYAPFGARYLGTANTVINQAFFTRGLIGIVARIYEPGCKLDTTIILEGGQGGGKSTAIRTLTDGLLPGVFTDEIADPGSKDAGLQMQGKLVIEFSEMSSLRKSDNDTIKGWLSRQTDRFRPPFGKVPKDYPRCCAFLASINPPASGYLRDPTGARRFWPVTVGELDNALIREDAAQIWAEAKHLYLSGVQWHLTKEEEELARVVQAARMEGDPWNALIADFVDSHTMSLKSTVKVSEIMSNQCLNIAIERRSVSQKARIEAYLSGPLRWTRVGDGIYQRPT